MNKVLGYPFNDKKLLERALTHRSFHEQHNERLEFLGDAVIGFVVATMLYNQFPDITEGQLSRLRSSFVNRERLTKLARELELDKHMRLGPAETQCGEATKPSILSDAMEAVIGAIYLDGGYEAVKQCIQTWYGESLSNIEITDEIGKDAKSRLQEYCQAHRYALPTYKTLKTEGKMHNQTFVVGCQLKQFPDLTAQGKGSTRQKAEQQAAQGLYEILQEQADSA